MQRRHQTLLDIAEGFYLAKIVYHFYRRGIFASLAANTSPRQLAVDHGYDAERFEALLEYVYLRTDLLARRGEGSYLVATPYDSHARFGFHLEKFLGAYGPLLDHLDNALAPGELEAEHFDDEALSRAFSGLDRASAKLSAHVVKDWQVGSLLDLGCGAGTLLIALASRDPAFRGWGVDSSETMHSIAVERVKSADLTDMIELIHGDVRDLASLIGPRVRKRIEGLHGASVLNEFFDSGDHEAVAFVKTLSDLFPGRLLFVNDYYGRLGQESAVDPAIGHTLLQDVAQVVSRQGVPPPTLVHWSAIYDRAGSQLVHAYEGEQAGICWFVHVVRL